MELETSISKEVCKNIPAKFRESSSKCSEAHPKNALWCKISASHSQNLAGMFLHYPVEGMYVFLPNRKLTDEGLRRLWI